MSIKTFFQNHLTSPTNDLLLTSLVFFKNHQRFQAALTPFWNLHAKDYDGRISTTSFKEHLSLIFKFLFPYFPPSEIASLVSEEVGLVVSPDHPDHILLDQFHESFARFCVFWIETPSVTAVLKLLELLFERTTKLVYRSLRGKDLKYSEVDYHIEVRFHRKDECERMIQEHEQKHRRDDIIYYHETLVLNKYLKDQAERDFEVVTERILMRPDEVLPMGYSLESILLQLMNENYSVNLINRDNRSLLVSEHFTTNANPFPRSVKLLAELNENIVQYLKTFLEHHIYFSCLVLEDPSPKDQEQPNYFRLSEVLDRKFIFKRLKSKTSPNPCYYNIVSAFHHFEDYEIDLIDKLHQEWHERSDDHEDLTPNPIFEGIDPDDQKLLPSNLYYLSIKKKIEHMHRDYQKAFLEEGDPQLPVETTLNFHNFVSKGDCLPFDNQDPYLDDLVEWSGKAPLQILVVSKPMVGRTAFCAEIAKQMDLVHVEPGLQLARILKKVKDFEENPEMDEEGQPKEFLLPLEREILNDLKSGVQVGNDSMLELVNLALDDSNVGVKGFVLDIPVIDSQDFSWLSQILNGNLRIPQIGCRYFSHVVSLNHPDQEVINFSSNVRENIEDLKLYSEYDRYMLKHPPPKPEGEEEEEGDEKKPLLDENLLARPSEAQEFLSPQLERFSQKSLKKLQSLTAHLTKAQMIDIAAAGLPPQQLAEVAVAKLGEFRDPLRPLPVRLEPGSEGNLKELLSQGLDEGKPWRKWSGFYQIDPVELMNSGRVVVGKPDFPVSFAGRVFLFEKEENLLDFMRCPAKYIKQRPKMPQTYNISICGPHLSGKKTYAELLSKCYGWKVVDVERLVGEALLTQKTWPSHTPSNPQVNKVHCSEPEWKEIFKGNALGTKNVLPLVCNSLGFRLQKRPPKPPPKEGEEGYEEYMAQQEVLQKEKELQESKEKPGSKKGPRPQEKGKGKKEEKIEEKEDDATKEPVIEDLALKDLSPWTDEYGQSPPIKGFIFLNFPVNEEQVQALKEFNITIDKVIFLVDTSDEETEPGKVLSTRAGFEELYSLENELLFSDTALKVLQEQLTEDVVKTVSIVGSINEVYNRMRTVIDPFYVRVDEESNVRVPADVQETDEPVLFGDYGPYCPVTLMDERWLARQKGETTEGLELQVQSRRYIFYSEKELKTFKANVEKYTQNTLKPVPPPRILFLGVRGAGLHTQLKLLNEKYKISVFDLKDELLAQLAAKKASRKQQRILTRPFKPKEINEEGQEIEDPELNEEAADFDRKLYEISVVSQLLSPLNEVFLNGNWFDLEEDQVSADLFELLQESKRMPEVVVVLRVKDKPLLARVFDETKIKADYNRQLDELRNKRIAERKAEREKLNESGEENIPEEEPMGPIEEDPEAPKLEEMIAEQRDKFLKRREDDLSKLEELSEKFKGANIPVVAIEADLPVPQVFKSLIWELKTVLEGRENLLERHLVIPIPEEKVSHYKGSYHTKKSRFGNFNAIEPASLPVTQDHAVIYRDRLYFFESEEQLQEAKLLPLRFLNTPEVPQDINYRPGIFLIGRPKSGVSSLAKLVAQNLGLVRIKVSKLLEDLDKNLSKLGFEALNLLRLGNSPTEEMCVELIVQRIQQKDCVEQGWVLDSFPNTVRQASLLASRGIIPNCVFSVQLGEIDIKTRVEDRMKEIRNEFGSLKAEFLKKQLEEMEENEELKKKRDSKGEYEFEFRKLKLGYDSFLLHQRLRKTGEEIRELESFYLHHYNNIKFLDGTLSKWGLYERAKSYIVKTVRQRQMLARALVLREPCVVGDLALGKQQILDFYSEFRNYCPVSFKAKQEFVPLSYRNRFLTFYNFRLYSLASQQHFNDFKAQPFSYLSKTLLKQHQEMPLCVEFEHWPEKSLKPWQEGYDVVELVGKSIKKGKKSLLVEYRKRSYLFTCVRNMRTFIRSPNVYAEAKLPTKFLEQKEENRRKVEVKDSSSSYLENNLANIVMKVLAQLGYNQLKYPTISPQETALKFAALSLKANNPNKDEYYRRKYQKKLKEFLSGCNLCQTYYQEHKRRDDTKEQGGDWNDWEEENYLKSAEELEVYLRNISSKDKTSYFYEYIR